MSALPHLILASGSPRRRRMLTDLGLRFEVRPVAIDESPLPGEAPLPYVQRLARCKAQARAEPGELVLAADTIVEVDGELLGKPAGEAEARQMLRRLSGREHLVATGIALFQPPEAASRPAGEAGRLGCHVVVSRVRFLPLSEEKIAWYTATGEPLDKAGAYAIQGLGALFVDSIDGNYSNVVGLPLPALAGLFEEMGYDLLRFRGT